MQKRLRDSIRNGRGQALIQTLISVAIMGIMMLAFSAMINNQSRETAALSQKLAAMDFQQQLTRTFADGTLCTALLTNTVFTPQPVQFTVPSGGATVANPVSLTLNYSRIPISVSTPTVALATAGQGISSLAPTLLAAKSQTFQLTNIAGGSNGTTGIFTGNFQINFDPANLIQAMRPVATQITLQTTGGVTGLQTITSCQSGVALGGSGAVQDVQLIGYGSHANSVSCPAGYTSAGNTADCSGGTCWGNETLCIKLGP